MRLLLSLPSARRGLATVGARARVADPRPTAKLPCHLQKNVAINKGAFILNKQVSCACRGWDPVLLLPRPCSRPCSRGRLALCSFEHIWQGQGAIHHHNQPSRGKGDAQASGAVLQQPRPALSRQFHAVTCGDDCCLQWADATANNKNYGRKLQTTSGGDVSAGCCSRLLPVPCFLVAKQAVLRKLRCRLLHVGAATALLPSPHS